MKVVIIEDEKLTANDLSKTLVKIDSSIEIVTLLHSVEEAASFFKSDPDVDLVFSDIELGDGLSFQIFEKFNISYPIIFCTAYNQYALEAFKTFGIDYILKPFDRTSIENALSKFGTLKEKTSPPKDDYSGIIQLLQQKVAHQLPSVLIHHGDKIIPLNGKEIALFYIEDEYTFAHSFEGKKHLLTQKMETLEKSFSPDFFRANRQFLVNRKAVKDASVFFARKMLINLNIPFEEQIVVGKLKLTAFTHWLSTV
jgi:two-component system, LytTR family, response regulator LytT